MTISVASLVPPNPSAGLPLTLWIGKGDDIDDDFETVVSKGNKKGTKGGGEEGKGMGG